MGRKRICPLCNETIEAHEASIEYKGKRLAHERCVNIAFKAVQVNKREKLEEKEEAKDKTKRKTKPKAELKDAMSEEEYQEKKQYFNYLRKLIQEDPLPAKIYAVTNDIIKKYELNYHSMYQTLVYLNEILEKDLTGDIVGLIPYYYTEALGYYEKIKKVEEINKDKDISKMYKKEIVYINTKPKRNKKIDINSIGIEENE